MVSRLELFFFFFNDTATTEIYTLSLHDALPISPSSSRPRVIGTALWPATSPASRLRLVISTRSEEHTSELQSQSNLVCRLLLEKKKKKNTHQQALRALRRQRSALRHHTPRRSPE